MLSHIHSVLKPTSVGSSFLFDAHISSALVNKLIKYNHHIFTPKISAGIIIMALAIQATASMIL
jgi:hypothetical protein